MRSILPRPLLLLAVVGLALSDTLPARASDTPPPDLDTLANRLLGVGEQLGTGYVRARDGTLSWTVLVDETFDAAEVEARGGAVDWAYPSRGVAQVRSMDLAFGDDLVTAGVARAAIVNQATERDGEALAGVRPAFTGTPDASRHWANGPDLYAENGLWWFYAIGAAEPVASEATVSGWTPEWQIQQDGAGVTIGNNDDGGPVLWCDPVDVRVDVDLPLWGVCALWGASLDGEDCVFEDSSALRAAGLCDDLGTLLGNPTTLDGDSCALADQSLADLYAVFYGWDYVNYDELSAFFRPRRLHPDFAWYVSAADAAADPSLGGPGGVLPIFASEDDYRAYYEDRYLPALIPAGVEVVNEQLAFAGAEVALTDAFAAALDANDIGACSTVDPRLPDPDSLDWVPYAYDLFDPPFDRFDVSPAGGVNGYDADGELRVIIDPTFGTIDLFGSAGAFHGTATASAMVARYQPGVVYGTIRGVAPGARLISYPGSATAMGILFAFRRAGDDGVLALNNSWVGYDYFSHWHKGNAEEVFTLAFEAAAEDLSDTTLLIFSAGNEAVDLNAIRAEWGTRSLVQGIPRALVVGGTAGRDYDWRGDIPWWMPDAAGRPYDRTRQAGNLDRPMIYLVGDNLWSGTDFGNRIDLVAPSGGVYLPEGCPETNPDCDEQYGDIFWFSWRFFEGVPDDPSGNYNVGVHAAGTGTSFAAPLVTGAAAVVAQAYEEAHGQPPTVAVLSALLTRTADDRVGPTVDLVAKSDAAATLATGEYVFDPYTVRVDKNGPDDWMGEGRLNVARAVEEAQK